MFSFNYVVLALLVSGILVSTAFLLVVAVVAVVLSGIFTLVFSFEDNIYYNQVVIVL